MAFIFPNQTPYLDARVDRTKQYAKNQASQGNFTFGEMAFLKGIVDNAKFNEPGQTTRAGDHAKLTAFQGLLGALANNNQTAWWHQA